jgi:hypothetical protein
MTGFQSKKAAAQEPVAWATRENFYRELDRRVECMRKEMEIKSVTMRCKDYDVALNIVDMYGGHVVVGQVSFPPQCTVQVSPLEFVEMVMDKEHLVGNPIVWAQWPNKEKNT